MLTHKPAVRPPTALGGSATDGAPFDAVCQGQAYVTGIAGSAEGAIKGLGPSLSCSDGVQVSLAAGNLINWPAFSQQSSGGFAGFDVKAGLIMDRLGVITAAGQVTYYGGDGGDERGQVRCREGSRLAGVFGKAEPNNVVSIGVYCRLA